MSLCEQVSTVSEYFLLRSYLSTHNVCCHHQKRKEKEIVWSSKISERSQTSVSLQYSPCQVSSSLLSRICCSRPNQTKGERNRAELPNPSSSTCLVAGTRPGFGNLQRIYWRAKPHEAVDAYPETNFVLGHEQWVPKEWVLKVPKVESTYLRFEKNWPCSVWNHNPCRTMWVCLPYPGMEQWWLSQWPDQRWA